MPPQINKFYVWDLAPGRSIVEFLVNAGHQVFIVNAPRMRRLKVSSWRVVFHNPPAATRGQEKNDVADW